MLYLILIGLLFNLSLGQECRDFDQNCRDWVLNNAAVCQGTEYIKRSCARSCGTCGGGGLLHPTGTAIGVGVLHNQGKRRHHRKGLRRRPQARVSLVNVQQVLVISPAANNNVPAAPNFAVRRAVGREFDPHRLSPELQPVSFLVGKWRSEHGGKAIFPTIPKFTFGEQIEFSIPDDTLQAAKALNYTAFAWSINEKDELHSEYGYISVKRNTRDVALTTVMNNGFVTVEEGPVTTNRIRFRLKDIGRISFSRDLPVHDLIREWTLLDKNTLQARLMMETLTHGMQEHTFIRYNRID